MNTNSIEMMSLNEFPGHEPCLCDMCQHRQAAVYLMATNEISTTNAHVCLTCFELAENSGFDEIAESVSPQRYAQAEHAYDVVRERYGRLSGYEGG